MAEIEGLCACDPGELGRRWFSGQCAYEVIGAEVGRLVTKKQAAYGDSFGKAGEFLRLVYPHGVPSEKYDDMLAVVRVFDKLMRIATDKDALGEDPWQDICGYALLAIRGNG